MYVPSPSLWAPQLRGVQETIRQLELGNSVCLHAPTGGGKTTVAFELMRWAADYGLGTCFYVNRRLLVRQTYDRFRKGIHTGVRAAEFEDLWDEWAPHQICSADTEKSRVIDRGKWSFHGAGLVIVDESHLQKTKAMEEILGHYKSKGAMIVGLTATPIEMGNWYDSLVMSGSMNEYRDCRALVPAKVYGIEQPDLRKVKRNPTGEYVLDGRIRKAYTQSIVGSVLKQWRVHNPDARPALMFSPGVEESVWLCGEFEKIGVPWTHVDATDAVHHGKRYRLSRQLWEDIQVEYRAGKIKGLSCKFKLREGVDLPCTYHAILATPIGSLASYIQTVGRVLRYSPETPDHVIVTDHGGNYHRHGSPNVDRPWDKWWGFTEAAVSEFHTNQIKDKKEPEPIRCPACGMERRSGITCPSCGHTHKKSLRRVIQEDGRIIEVEGNLVRPRYTKLMPDTQRHWDNMFWGYKHKGVKATFNQMAGYFYHLHGYYPPKDLAHMPKNEFDWYARPCDIDMGKLRGAHECAT